VRAFWGLDGEAAKAIMDDPAKVKQLLEAQRAGAVYISMGDEDAQLRQRLRAARERLAGGLDVHLLGERFLLPARLPQLLFSLLSHHVLLLGRSHVRLGQSPFLLSEFLFELRHIGPARLEGRVLRAVVPGKLGQPLSGSPQPLAKLGILVAHRDVHGPGPLGLEELFDLGRVVHYGLGRLAIMALAAS